MTYPRNEDYLYDDDGNVIDNYDLDMFDDYILGSDYPDVDYQECTCEDYPCCGH